jgi:hypothetical protein
LLPTNYGGSLNSERKNSLSGTTVEFLRNAGAIGGIAGLAIGALLLIFRDVIRKLFLKTLPQELAYKLVRLMIVAVWSVAILGILIKFAPEGAMNVAIGNNNVQSTTTK